MKTISTTEAAFQEMLWRKDSHLLLQIETGYRDSLRLRFKKGQITLELMEKSLQKAGYKVVQEKVWQEPG
jgi:hypothetical protein